MRKYSAIIVDDEAHSRDLLDLRLKKYCPEIAVIELCKGAPEAHKAVNRCEPELVFIDVEMPGSTGVDFLREIGTRNFYPVFVTGHSKYAIEAIKEEAFDYLLKPVSSVELRSCIDRFVSRIGSAEKRTSENTKRRTLELKDRGQSHFVELHSIRYLRAAGSYSEVFTEKGSFVISKNLKHFDIELKNQGFFRIHHNTLINLGHIDRFIHEGNYLYMTNGEMLRVSFRKKEAFLEEMRGR